jgi:hypothetical protein
MRITRSCRVTVAAACIWSLAAAVADGRITHIGISPVNPSPNDSVIIMIDGYMGDGCWHIDSLARSRSGNTFAYNIGTVDGWQPGSPCPMVVIEYHIRDTVGILPEGTYVIAMTEWHQSVREPLPDFGSAQFTVFGFTGVSQGGAAGIPDRFTVYQNYPNPFNGSTVIAFDIVRPGPANVEIFDVLGRCMSRHHIDIDSPGRHTTSWDGLDQSARSVSSGVYFYRVTTGGMAQTRKMVLMK